MALKVSPAKKMTKRGSMSRVGAAIRRVIKLKPKDTNGPFVPIDSGFFKAFIAKYNRPPYGLYTVLELEKPKQLKPRFVEHTDRFEPAEKFIVVRGTPEFLSEGTGFVRSTEKHPSGVHVVLPKDAKVRMIVTPTEETDAMMRPLLLREKLLRRVVTRVGCDPEIFVEDSKGALIPAFDFLPGKEAPAKTAKELRGGDGGGEQPMYWDGFQAEFQTQANTCLGYHGDSVWCGLAGVLAAAQKVDPKAVLSARPTVLVTPEVMARSKDEHVEFGCMPSENLYGLKSTNTAPARETFLRSAGGHMHLELPQEDRTPEKIKAAVRAMDAILGVACVSLFAGYDDPRRREYYGMAGEYRVKPYGFEYRVLSNAWLYHPILMNLVFDIGRKAVTLAFADEFERWDATEEETVLCIQNNDVKLARKILKRNEKLFTMILQLLYGNPVIFNEKTKTNVPVDMVGRLWDAFYKGMETLVENPKDIARNWDLPNATSTPWKYHFGNEGKCIARANKIVLEEKKVA